MKVIVSEGQTAAYVFMTRAWQCIRMQIIYATEFLQSVTFVALMLTAGNF